MVGLSEKVGFIVGDQTDVLFPFGLACLSRQPRQIIFEILIPEIGHPAGNIPGQNILLIAGYHDSIPVGNGLTELLKRW